MAEYYLISQLPSLDGLSETMPMPITEERFFELCERFLSKKTQNALSKLSLLPSRENEETGSEFLNKWNDGERNLRLVLAKIRADKMNKNFDTDKVQSAPVELIQTAREAVESGMIFRNPEVIMGNEKDPYGYMVTSARRTTETISQLKIL